MQPKISKKTIDDEIDHVLKTLGDLDPKSKEYQIAVDNLRVLTEAKSKKPARLVENETIVMAATNILGILLILNYENLHVITTKALGFVAKGRI